VVHIDTVFNEDDDSWHLLRSGFYQKGVVMESYFMGIDVSKGYADFVILDAKKNIVEPNFQLDDTFKSHCKLFDILKSAAYR